MRALYLLSMGLTLAACGVSDVPNIAYLPAQEELLRNVELSDEVLTTEAPLPAPNTLGLSDEQDFGAVSDRQSIESDAERLERNRALYTLIEPTEVPKRPGTDIPNIVAYALKTSNPVGEPLYSRSAFKSENLSRWNCAKHVSDAAAQEAFLKSGGPERDRYGLDPDGDGYACRWDPTPFRAVINK